MPYFFSNACASGPGLRRRHRGVERQRAFFARFRDEALVAVGALIGVDRRVVGAGGLRAARVVVQNATADADSAMMVAEIDVRMPKRDMSLQLLSDARPLVAQRRSPRNAADPP